MATDAQSRDRARRVLLVAETSPRTVRAIKRHTERSKQAGRPVPRLIPRGR